MSDVIIADGGQYRHDPSDGKTYTVDWDTDNLSANAAIASQKFKLVTLAGTTLEQTVSSLTRSGSTATVTTASAHGFSSGDSITIMGCDPIGSVAPSEYNGTFTITVTGATTFTYSCSTVPATPATIDAKVTAITCVKGIDQVSLLSGNRKTQLRFTVYGNYLGSLVELSNLIVTNETPAQAKERSFRLLIQD